MAESEKGIRILYVCPLAHWAGHQPQAVTKESSALLKAGAEVSICTFRGILDQREPQTLPHRTVVSSWTGFPIGIAARLLHIIPKGKNLAWFLEQLATIYLAVKLRKTFKYDVIYLRDGDPFIFISLVLGLVLKHYRWAINLIGVKSVRSPGSLFYRFINAPFWKPIYHRSLCQNRFTFICENRYTKDYFETYLLDGILSGRVRVVPIGVEKAAGKVPKREARQYLNLPEDKTIFLNFGALHPGKDIETVLSAIRDVTDVLLVHAGEVAPQVNLIQLVERYGLQSRLIIRDCYIPETEKPYYFAASDAIILSYKRDFWQTASMLWEAAKFRLPAIASESGELGELTEQYGIGTIFKAEDASSLKKALSAFLGYSQRERETMASNCEKLCDDFSLDSWAQNCLEIFGQLCGNEVRVSGYPSRI